MTDPREVTVSDAKVAQRYSLDEYAARIAAAIRARGGDKWS